MQIQKYYSTLIWCSIALIIGLKRHFGIFAFVFACVLLFSIVKFIKHAIFKDNEKKQSFINVVFWSLSLVIIITKHTVVHFQVRDIADSISDQVLYYYSEHGDYPPDLESLTVNKKDLDKIDVFYTRDKSEAYLMYLVTWTIRDLYKFNFKTKKWDYLSP